MEQKTDKYKKILEAATKVFARHGFYSSRVADIAEEAGVASGTIYLYFRNKEDLIICIFEEAVQDLLKHLHGIEGRSPENDLKNLIKQHLLRMEDDQHLARVFQIQLRQANPHIRQGIGTPLKDYFNFIEAVLERGKEEGVFRQDQETRLMRKMVFGTLDEICTRWVLSGSRYSLEEMIPSIWKLLLSAIKMEERTEQKEVWK